MIRFGEMLINLEAVVDNSFMFDVDPDTGERVIVGRRPGVRGWLAKHCPLIGYKTAMRYKTLAQKAQKVADSKSFIQQSPPIYKLEKSFNSTLQIEHIPLSRPRPPPRQWNHAPLVYPGSGDPALRSIIHTLRKRIVSPARLLPSPRRNRLIAALSSFVSDIQNSQ